jgi:hypothetical protein
MARNAEDGPAKLTQNTSASQSLSNEFSQYKMNHRMVRRKRDAAAATAPVIGHVLGLFGPHPRALEWQIAGK